MPTACNLTKWASNSELVMDAIDPAKRASSPFMEFNSIAPLKHLACHGTTLYSSHRVESSHPAIQWQILLSLASKIFDTLGLITPFIVRAKTLFQCLWLSGLHWGDPLDSDIKAKWLSWKSVLLDLKDVTIPRCFGNRIMQDCCRSASFWICFPQGVWSSNVHSNKSCLLYTSPSPRDA